MKNKITFGHCAALITIIIWGTTFISTKVLLNILSPIEILFIRFLIGYIILWSIYPHHLHLTHKKEELYFMAAGLCGVTLYYLFENIALTYTLASNVGVIISIAPFFTVIFACLFLHEEKPHIRFFIGFIIAMMGIYLISFSGSQLQLNPFGDFLAIIAAIIWAGYSTLTKKLAGFGYHIIQTTRRTFFYGLLFILPFTLMMGFDVDFSQIVMPINLFNLLFLGLGASALCFVTWNLAVKILGSVKTSVYIYIVPVITAMTSTFILHEKMTFTTLLGIILTLVGLLLSENKKTKKENIIYEYTE